MTSLNEIKSLQAKARRAGRVANLCFEENNTLTGVFYLDPRGGPRTRAGCVLSVLSFAEIERTRPAWLEEKRPKRSHGLSPSFSTPQTPNP